MPVYMNNEMVAQNVDRIGSWSVNKVMIQTVTDNGKQIGISAEGRFIHMETPSFRVEVKAVRTGDKKFNVTVRMFHTTNEIKEFSEVYTVETKDGAIWSAMQTAVRYL